MLSRAVLPAEPHRVVAVLLATTSCFGEHAYTTDVPTGLQETRSISGVRLFNGQDAIVDGLEVWVGEHPNHSRNQARPSADASLCTACSFRSSCHAYAAEPAEISPGAVLCMQAIGVRCRGHAASACDGDSGVRKCAGGTLCHHRPACQWRQPVRSRFRVT